MKNGLVIADSGPIFSLAIINKLDLLNLLFDEIKISKAVWEEITLNKTTSFFNRIEKFFRNRVCEIKGFNELSFIMDYGESESIVLYKELHADFLLIDDKKARKIAENFGINCVGTIGLLSTSKDKGFIKELRPIFKFFLENKRFYSLNLLNTVLIQKDEKPISY